MRMLGNPYEPNDDSEFPDILTAMVIVILALLLLVSHKLQGAEFKRVDVKVADPKTGRSMSVAQPGSNVRVTCHVPHDTTNRDLKIALADAFDDVRSSDITLDGEHASITYDRVFYRVPCGGLVAYCSLHTGNGRWFSAQTPLLVSCDQDR